MKNYEFNNFINAVKDAFPKFNPHSEVILNGWKQALGDATLDEAKAAVVRYVAEKSSKFEPQPREIAEILEGIRKNRGYVCAPVGDLEPDYDIRYQKLDQENGEKSWLVPHYAAVWRLIQRDYWPFVQNIYHPTHEEFRECMKRWCLQKYGREKFFLSDNDIRSLGEEERKKFEAEVMAVIRGGIMVKTFGKSEKIFPAMISLHNDARERASL